MSKRGSKVTRQEFRYVPQAGNTSSASGGFDASNNKLIIHLPDGTTLNLGNLNGTAIPTPFPPTSLPQSTTTPFTTGTSDFTPVTLTTAVLTYKVAVLAVFGNPSSTNLNIYITATNSLVQALLDIANASALQIEALTATVNKILGD